jgi:hypothetical protein
MRCIRHYHDTLPCTCAWCSTACFLRRFDRVHQLRWRAACQAVMVHPPTHPPTHPPCKLTPFPAPLHASQLRTTSTVRGGGVRGALRKAFADRDSRVRIMRELVASRRTILRSMWSSVWHCARGREVPVECVSHSPLCPCCDVAFAAHSHHVRYARSFGS